VKRVAAGDIERIVLDALAARLNVEAISDADALVHIERDVQRVEVHRDRLLIRFSGAAESTPSSVRDTSRDATISVPWSPPASRPKHEIALASEPAAAQADTLQTQLIAAIDTARDWMQQLTSGAVAGVEAIAKREGKHARSIRTALSFAFLAPDIVEQIIAGNVPSHLTLTDIGRGLPMLWSEQRRMMAA
jgi:hypothetical protein